MRERTSGHAGRPPKEALQDQAAGLRRLFAAPQPQWVPILLAPERDLDNAAWLALLAQTCVEQGARTLIVDAARAQVASAFGLRARYDLAHALNGDCAPVRTCIAAGANLGILPAARALEQSGRGAERLRRFAAGVRALAGPADCVLLVLPAAHGRSLAGFCDARTWSDAVVVAGATPSADRQVIDTMRAILSVADIGAFRLLFQGMAPDCAGSLYSRLAAAGARELGVSTSNAGSVHDASALKRLVRLVRCRSTPGGGGARGDSRPVETFS